MSYLHNDPADFVSEALAGFARVHADRVAAVDGGVVRERGLDAGRVALVVGGGSGHYPAFAGVVGPGLAAGAVCGNVFTSPSAGQAYRVARAAEAGGGVLYSYGNYAGDVLHFGEAERRLRADGVDARTVLVTDDIASAPRERLEERRGIAGDFVVFKIAGAAAERGDGLDEVERLARLANHRTRTLGVAFAGCRFPGAEEPLFTVPEGMMSIGLGIHGEPGIRDVPATSADELARILLDELLDDVPDDRGDRAVVLVNGLGSVKYEELFLLFRAVAERLDAEGVGIVQPECGELVTSLDMAGASVTLLWLTPELEELWAAPADTPAYRKGSVATPDGTTRRTVTAPLRDARGSAPGSPAPAADPRSQDAARRAVAILGAIQATIHDNADELGRIDAIAGDGDHGVGMRHGVDAATATAAESVGLGLAAQLDLAAEAWSERAGGTSGALWAAAIRAAGRVLDDPEPSTTTLARAARAGLDAIVGLGKAELGDKTMVDAIVPYLETLERGLADGSSAADALEGAAHAAHDAAQATSSLRPRRGRARPLAEKSLGHPDAGAVSFALVVAAIADAVRKEA